MKLNDVKKLLDQNNYKYETKLIHNSAVFYENKGFKPNKEFSAFWILTIPNPNHQTGVDLVFADDSDNPDFYDMEFGGYYYELFGCRDEELLDELLEEIRRIVAEQTFVVFATDAKTGKWFFDAVYFNLPEMEMNNMNEFQHIISKMKKPKSLWRKLRGRTDVYEIYSWSTYERIVK